MIIGAQTYSLREYLKNFNDIEPVFEFIKSCGASAAEVAFGGMAPVTPLELKAISERTGLEISSTHSDFERVRNDIDRLADEHAEYGCKIIGLGSMPSEYRTLGRVNEFIDIVNTSAAKIADRGMSITYHNHAFEFKGGAGNCIYDALVNGLSGNATFTLDIYWAKVGGVSVEEYIKKLGSRLQIMHLKDYKTRFLGLSHTMCAPGDGILPIAELAHLAESQGTAYGIVEIDAGKNLKEAVQRGIEFSLKI